MYTYTTTNEEIPTSKITVKPKRNTRSERNTTFQSEGAEGQFCSGG